jgi:hypothetical protein
VFRSQSLGSCEIVSGGRAGAVVLASCLGDEDTGGGLFSFDGHCVERIDRLSSTGLSIAEDRLARLLRSRGDTDSSGEILIYDSQGVRGYHRVDGLADPHDIVWDGQHFIVVSSFTNSVVWISPSGEIVRKWQAPGEGDARHLNCLLIKDGRLLVCAFGRFTRHRQWTEDLSSKSGIVFDLETDEDVLTGLSHPHQARFLDGAWAVCNSMARELLRIDPSTSSVVGRLQLDGYTRGITVTDDLLFVGESANRGLNPGTEKTAQIAVVCRKTWRLLDRLILPCREIYDLVVAPRSLEEGVRRGFRTNPQRVAEQDQYAMFDSVGIKPVRLWATGDPLPPEACKITIRADIPSTLPPDALFELHCAVHNLGQAILVSAPPNPVHISYKWFHAGTGTRVEGMEGLRTKLPQSLHPHQALSCKLKVDTPKTEGQFVLLLTLVQEHIAWFDDLSASNSVSRSVQIVELTHLDATL